MQARDLDRQRLGLQPEPATGPAGAVVLILLKFLADPVAVGLAIAALHVGDDAFETAGDLIDAAALVITELDFLVARAAQEHLLHLFGQILPRGVLVELVMAGDGLDGLQEIGRLALAPGRQRTVIDLEALIWHHEAFVKEQLDPQTIAFRAGTIRRVEREQAGFDLGDGKARDGAGKVFRKGDAFGLALAGCGFQDGNARGEVERGAQAVGEPGFQPFAHHDAVDHHVDIVAEFLVQCRRLVQLVELAIHLDPLKALLAQFQKLLAVFALAIAHDGGQQIAAGALLHRHDAINHVLHLLRLDGQAGGRAIGRACAREQQPHIVVDLGHRADRRARVLAGGLLLDGNRRGQTADMVHIRLFHHVEELTRIGGQRFHIAPLPFGIDGIKGQAGLARAGKAGDHHQLIAWNIHVDPLEIMLARAAYLDELLLSHELPSDPMPQR